MSRFWCDDSFHVIEQTGTLSDLIEYDLEALAGAQWQQVIAKCDRPTLAAMAADLKAGRIGTSHTLCNIAKNGARFYFTTRTFSVSQLYSPPKLGGITTLEAWESPRTYIQCDGFKSKLLLLLIQVGIYAEQIASVFL